VATLPMPAALEASLRNYLENQWKPNFSGLLFPNHEGTKPRKRESVVQYGLKPVLRKLGIPEGDTGLHALRHGLATELAEASVPLTVLQQQPRHADVNHAPRLCSRNSRDPTRGDGGRFNWYGRTYWYGSYSLNAFV